MAAKVAASQSAVPLGSQSVAKSSMVFIRIGLPRCEVHKDAVVCQEAKDWVAWVDDL